MSFVQNAGAKLAQLTMEGVLDKARLRSKHAFAAGPHASHCPLGKQGMARHSFTGDWIGPV